MTKEEVIEILGRFVLGAKPCSQREIVDACASAYGMLKEQSSLPSDLDEAADIAKELAYKTWSEGDNWSDAAIKTFKAGAEWMAGQGETREVDVKEDAGGYPFISKIELYDYDKDEPLFKASDKVVVQIRKK